MSVVAEREPTGDLREIELRRHLQIMARSLERAEAGSSLTMVLRSPSSDPAKALIGLKGALKRTGLGARVSLAHLDPADDLRPLFATLTELSPHGVQRATAPASKVASLPRRVPMRTLAPRYELLRRRLADGEETTVYVVRYPRLETRLSIEHFAVPPQAWATSERRDRK